MNFVLQDRLFSESEADAYFDRRQISSRSNSERLKHDLPLILIKKSKIVFENVAEVGAYDGFRLAHLNKHYGCKATAFEPSRKAIEKGRDENPSVTFFQRCASNLEEAQDSEFDLIIVDFVFHWIDRSTLLKSVAEIDRVLAENGHLIIGDFDVDSPAKQKYHHLPDDDIWTYKQKYDEIFTSTRCFELLATEISGSNNDDPVGRRCCLMKKNQSSQYSETN